MAKKKGFIQEAIKNPGALHNQLGIPQGEKIPMATLKNAAKQPGKLGQRARLALTLKKLRGKKGSKRGRSSMFSKMNSY